MRYEALSHLKDSSFFPLVQWLLSFVLSLPCIAIMFSVPFHSYNVTSSPSSLHIENHVHGKIDHYCSVILILNNLATLDLGLNLFFF